MWTLIAIFILVLYLLNVDLLVNWGCGGYRLHHFTHQLTVPSDTDLLRAIGEHGTREVTAHGATTKLGGPALRKALPQLYAELTSESALAQYSQLAGERLYLADRADGNSVFVKSYQGTSDAIGWHRDPNHTPGRRYTAILPLSISPCNTSELQVMGPEGQAQSVDIRPGQGVMFNPVRSSTVSRHSWVETAVIVW